MEVLANLSKSHGVLRVVGLNLDGVAIGLSLSCIPARKNKSDLPQSESRRIRLLRFPSGAAVIQHRFFPETDVCLFLLEVQEHVPALRIGSACSWAPGECGYAPRNYLRLLSVRYGTPFARELGRR
jgi:hypothetical protein